MRRYGSGGQASFRPRRFTDKVARTFQRKFQPVFDETTRRTFEGMEGRYSFKEPYNPVLSEPRKKSEGKVEAGVGGTTWRNIELWSQVGIFGQGPSQFRGASPATIISTIGKDTWKTFPVVDVNDHRGQPRVISSFSMKDLLDGLQSIDPNSMVKIYATKYPNDEGDTFSQMGIWSDSGQWVILYKPEFVARSLDKHYGLAQIPFEPA